MRGVVMPIAYWREKDGEIATIVGIHQVGMLGFGDGRANALCLANLTNFANFHLVYNSWIS